MSPKIRKCLVTWIVTSLCLLYTASNAAGQSATVPETQELLNGLKILFWPRPGGSQVLVKLRIHSGSAFDLAGKAGEMALLGDILFPDSEIIDYFTDQMGGKLNVAVSYDSITITMVGKADQINNILEVLRNAVIATQLTPEVVSRVREARIKLVKDSAVSPVTVADRAIAVRLFGDFPYGRPTAGFAEDLARIDRADLMLARERFLNSNNATLAIVGDVNQSRTMRTLKQLLGPWRRSEQIVPSTFRVPKTPEQRTLIVNIPSPSTEVRVAYRGVARSDQDFHAAAVLARIAQNRWVESTPELASKPTFARSDSYTLPGLFVLGTAVNVNSASNSLSSAKKVLEGLVIGQVSFAELDRAKREVLSEANSHNSKTDSEPDPWLDVDTYRLGSVQDRATSFQAVSAADIQRVATRIFKDAPSASVIVGDAPQLKSALEGKVQYEVLGEAAPKETPPKETPIKPPTKPGAIPSPS